MGILLDIDSKPLPWLPPTDYPPSLRKTPPIGGVSSFLGELRNAHAPKPWTKTAHESQKELRQLKEAENKRKVEFQRSQWKPELDPNIRGNPFATLFVARLPYAAQEDEVLALFREFGKIESVRIIPDRGYAFVLFTGRDGPEAVRAAVRSTSSGVLLHGRRVLTDYVKGKVRDKWKPMRLGGGEGGRFSLQRQRDEFSRAQRLQRKESSPFKRDSRGMARKPFPRRDDRAPQPPYRAKPHVRNDREPSSPRPSHTGRTLRQY